MLYLKANIKKSDFFFFIEMKMEVTIFVTYSISDIKLRY